MALTESRVIKSISNNGSAPTNADQAISEGEASFKYVQMQPIYTEDTYNSKSTYLKRELEIKFTNPSTRRSYSLKNAKMSISGAKYIGIQQDEFKITLQNINFHDFGRIVNSGFKEVTVTLDDVIVFNGMLKTINTGRDSIVEKTIELNCLRKVTDLLSDMVSPITVDSSTNIWSIMEDVLWNENLPAENKQIIEKKDVIANKPKLFDTLTFGQAYTFSGYKKTVIDDIIKITNDRLNRLTNSNLNWLDYTYRQDGVLDLFSPYVITEILNIQPFTGLIDTPTVSEDSVSFNAIYKNKLIPGRVVHMDNALFKTLGNNSAFIYAWDPEGKYVITEVRYSLSNYPNSYTCSCKARSLSKYNNFTASLGG